MSETRNRFVASPAPGSMVRDPLQGDYLPAEGREVELSMFWQRRINDGDVRVTTAPLAQSVQDHDQDVVEATPRSIEVEE